MRKLIFVSLIAAAAMASTATPAVAADKGQAAASPAGTATTGTATPLAEGEVRRLDLQQGKVTLKHGEIRNLDMPPMTMVFRVKDPSMLAGLKVGDKIRFSAEQIDGNMVVTGIEPGK